MTFAVRSISERGKMEVVVVVLMFVTAAGGG